MFKVDSLTAGLKALQEGLITIAAPYCSLVNKHTQIRIHININIKT